jgi:hypothetical protein
MNICQNYRKKMLQNTMKSKIVLKNTELNVLTYQIEKSVKVTKNSGVLSHMGLSHTQRAALLKTYSYTYAIHSYLNKNETSKH